MHKTVISTSEQQVWCGDTLMATLKFVGDDKELDWLITFHEQQDQSAKAVNMSEWQINSIIYGFTGKNMYQR